MRMQHAAVATVLAVALAGCAQLQELQSKLLPGKGRSALNEGIGQYRDGHFGAAAKSLQTALDLGLGDADRARAYKYLAFIHCGSEQIAPCRDDFRRALSADPAFDLAPAETGHPIWGPVFRAVKAEGASLSVGLKQYNEGDYAASATSLQVALDRGLPAKDQAIAHKHLAFIHCANNRTAACREEFRKALAVDPALQLAPAEAGHPVWGPIFRSLRDGK